MGFRGANAHNSMSFEDFRGGGFMLSFNLCPDECAGALFHRPKSGHLDVILTFNEPLNFSGTVYFVSLFDSNFQIDGERNCMVVDNEHDKETMADDLL